MPNRRSEDARGRGGGRDRAGPSPRPDGPVPPGGREAAGPVDRLDLPWGLPGSFLGLDEEASAFDEARAVILPVPYESTTSWGGGTQAGPGAILHASRYVELWDQELRADPSTVGIHTLPALELTRAGAEPAMEELEEAYGKVLDASRDRFLMMLGGEHSISAPAIRAVAARADSRISVLQLDAHADLRATYEGTSASHASAMRRVLDEADLVGVGIRGISKEEVEIAESTAGVTLLFADEMWDDDAWMDRALDALGDPVYITFDVDFLDPSLMPAT
ncbi:MAG: arginase family protein, partial [Gemmatimonadetes bacterium]|nr:arginase family protein [Gemmatimonadota bacterium]